MIVPVKDIIKFVVLSLSENPFRASLINSLSVHLIADTCVAFKLHTEILSALHS